MQSRLPNRVMKYRASGATFSPCKKYRYDLWREWGGLFDSKGNINFICLNPSTADEYQDDPTIRRCVGFAKQWGYSSMHMLNIFAYRSTDPEQLKLQSDPIGPENDKYLSDAAGKIVVAWGNWGSLLNRSLYVREKGIIKAASCFGLTDAGEPKHPLYLSKETELIEW